MSSILLWLSTLSFSISSFVQTSTRGLPMSCFSNILLAILSARYTSTAPITMTTRDNAFKKTAQLHLIIKNINILIHFIILLNKKIPFSNTIGRKRLPQYHQNFLQGHFKNYIGFHPASLLTSVLQLQERLQHNRYRIRLQPRAYTL